MTTVHGAVRSPVRASVRNMLRAYGGTPAPVWEFLPMETGALTAEMTFTRASTAPYTDENGDPQTAAINEPRFDHDGGGTPLGLLLEAGELCIADLSAVVDLAAGGTVFAEFNSATITTAPIYVLGSHTSCRLAYSNSGQANLNGYDGATSITFGPAFANNTVYRIAITETPAGASAAYTNGALVQAKSASVVSNFDGTLYVGIQHSANSLYILNGHIRSIRIWDQALSAAECLALTAA